MLLSAEPRVAYPLPAFDDTNAYLNTSEIAHTVYAPAPGAVDVFVSYRSSWVPDVSVLTRCTNRD